MLFVFLLPLMLVNKDYHKPKYYTVILKSRLRVTQGHWKRNHCICHTRLTISRDILRCIFQAPLYLRT